MKKIDDGLNSNLTPGLDDSIFSPTGDDALLIEGDNNSSNESAENQGEVPTSQEIFEPIELDAVEEVKEEIETEAFEIKQPRGSQKSKKPQVKSKGKTEKKRSAFPIFILLLLAICGGVWYYFSRPKPQPVVQQPKEAQVVVEKPQVKNIPPEPMVIDTVPPAAPVPPPARIATKYKVPKGWLVGYRAVPDEAEAIKIVAELSYIDSLPCGYYWINDVRQAEKLFKIYVGPYNTKEEAEAVLPSIQMKRADAHVYTEDK